MQNIYITGTGFWIPEDGLYEYLKKRFSNVYIKKFEGMRHEIQNEPSKNELLSLIDKFL